MKKTIVCIFAHPDDEAFGPGGTIAKLAQENDVYILCATRGQAGQDAIPSDKDLGKRRANELKKSAQILGVKKVYFLGFRDGYLSNALYSRIIKKAQTLLEKLHANTILAIDPTGGSGHIDHIVMSSISSYLYEHIDSIKQIMYYCFSDQRASHPYHRNYFVYFPKGYKKEEVSKVIDVSDVWDTVKKAMQAHKSQKEDIKRITTILDTLPKEDYFLIKNK